MSLAHIFHLGGERVLAFLLGDVEKGPGHTVLFYPVQRCLISVPTPNALSPIRISSHFCSRPAFTDIIGRENTQCPLLDSVVSSFTNDEGQTSTKKKKKDSGR